MPQYRVNPVMTKLTTLVLTALLLACVSAHASAVSAVGKAIAKVASHTADDAAKAGAKVLAHEGDDVAKAGGKLLANNADDAAKAGARVAGEAASHAAPVLVRTADSALDVSLVAARKAQPVIEVVHRPPIPRPHPAETALKTITRPGTVLAATAGSAGIVAANNLTRGDKSQDDAIGTAITDAAGDNPDLLATLVDIRNKPKTRLYTLLGVGGCGALLLIAGAFALHLSTRRARPSGAL